MILTICMMVLFFRVLGALLRMGFGLMGWLFGGSGLAAVVVLAVLLGGAFRIFLPLLFGIGIVRILAGSAGRIG